MQNTPTKNDRLRRQIRRRRSTLGAAMLEAAVVMPVLGMFYGLMTYNFKSYDTRIKGDAQMRALVSDSASHSCQGGSANLASMGLGILEGATTGAASKHGDQGAAQILGNMVQSAAQSVTQQVLTKWASRTVTSNVKMTCNEKPFDGNIGTWFKYAASAFTGGGGSFP